MVTWECLVVAKVYYVSAVVTEVVWVVLVVIVYVYGFKITLQP